ncbi:hypothetical protein ACNSOO_04780 [Aliarcobacter lanthieri]|uniref:hypothetical protein n=1 Tax=Aliarcobacter lanthieri TaxID=1355374 RepID=UPI003AAEF3FB
MSIFHNKRASNAEYLALKTKRNLKEIEDSSLSGINESLYNLALNISENRNNISSLEETILNLQKGINTINQRIDAIILRIEGLENNN